MSAESDEVQRTRVDYTRLAGRDIRGGDRARITVGAQLRTALARLKTRRARLLDELEQLGQIGEVSVKDADRSGVQPAPDVAALAATEPAAKPREEELPPLAPKPTVPVKTFKKKGMKRDHIIAFSPLHAMLQRQRAQSSVEELVLQREKIRLQLQEFQASAGKRLNRGKEPPRTKTHWDYLLEEMEWMAKDFKQEHAWKLALAKRTARSVQRTLERRASEKSRRLRQEILRRRRMAAFVSREIQKYWSTIRKLVQRQSHIAIEARKKKSRSKHLQLLVDQSEQFSSMIADDLQRDVDTESPAPGEEANGSPPIPTESSPDAAGEDSIPPSPSKLAEVEKDAAESVDDGIQKSRLGVVSSEATKAQPTGNTLSTSKVKTPLPSLLRFGTLREYQHIGLDWLVSMYDHGLNVILADEMGLGKTIMTIALLAHLAGERGEWGPHLIVVPTSVLVNWEMEFKRWLPGFKIVSYYGSAKERKLKRSGWNTPNAFHVVITSYKLAVTDQHVFRRRHWHYLILDEAQYIKNFRSQRWQTLINLKTKRRLLLTGTPLQNSLMELWSLMHFLMPRMFASQKEFQEWFADPVNQMLEGSLELSESEQQSIIPRLHKVLRPFLLRRLKKDVAEQLPGKHEHVISCRLSRRQRRLYEDVLTSSDAKRTMSSGNYVSLMNLLMQLRKVCNHPDLFVSRPVLSPFYMTPLRLRLPALVSHARDRHPFRDVSPHLLAFLSLLHASQFSSLDCAEVQRLQLPADALVRSGEALFEKHLHEVVTRRFGSQSSSSSSSSLFAEVTAQHVVRRTQNSARLQRLARFNALCCQPPLLRLCSGDVLRIGSIAHNETLRIVAPVPMLRFICGVEPALAPVPVLESGVQPVLPPLQASVAPLVHAVAAARRMSFPDKLLLQFDCGKLQILAQLLRQLQRGAHRVLIFAQMTRMLDILEAFLNIHGYTYVRLDGSTRVDERQRLMERFNSSDRIFVFLLSTRSGGLGINLTGADSVVFYDTDWNPAMDQQAQDRCHRIGQTREVHIYRLVCRDTVEENILRKANQKRLLGDLVIGAGAFTTEFFKAVDPRELLGIAGTPAPPSEVVDETERAREMEIAMLRAEDESDRQAAQVVLTEQCDTMSNFDEKSAAAVEVEAFRAHLEASLRPIEVWSLRRIEAVDPIVCPQSMEKLDAMIEHEETLLQEEQKRHVHEVQERCRRTRQESARVAAGLPIPPPSAKAAPPEPPPEEPAAMEIDSGVPKNDDADGDAENIPARNLKPSRATVLRTTRFKPDDDNPDDDPILFYVRAGNSMTAEALSLAQLKAVRAFASRHHFLFDLDQGVGCWRHPFGTLRPPLDNQVELYLPPQEDNANDPALWGLFATPDALSRMFRRHRLKKKPLRRRPQKRRTAFSSSVTNIKIRIPRSKVPGFKSLKKASKAPVQASHARKAPASVVVATTAAATAPPPVASKPVVPTAKVVTATLPSRKAALFPWHAIANSIATDASVRLSFPSISAWTESEDALLLCFVALYGRNWSMVASALAKDECVGGLLRTPQQCSERYAVLQRRVDELAKVWERRSPAPPLPGSEVGAQERACEFLLFHANAPDPSALIRAFHRLGRATKSNMQHAVSCKRALRAPLTGRPNDSAREALNHCHPSHARVLAEAHRALNIPESSLGATLSPRQIIELRSLRDRHKASAAAVPNATKKQQLHHQQQQRQQQQRQQFQQQRQQQQQQQTVTMAVASPQRRTEAGTSVPSLPAFAVSEGANTKQDADASLPTTHFLRYVLQHQPDMKGSVLETLQRKDWTQTQKFEHIAAIFRHANERNSSSAGAPSLNDASSAVASVVAAAAHAAAAASQNLSEKPTPPNLNPNLPASPPP